jgi:hypothetical protein
MERGEALGADRHHVVLVLERAVAVAPRAGGIRGRSGGAGGESEASRGVLPDCGRGGWGRARRLGGPGAAKVGEDGLDGEGVLDGGDNAQPAATAGTSEDI